MKKASLIIFLSSYTFEDSTSYQHLLERKFTEINFRKFSPLKNGFKSSFSSEFTSEEKLLKYMQRSQSLE
uniref:Uncharacterized protein n=1 Tax=Romanomermis culicivorax TaxID=13658 RepID=A0A915KBD9_ROMCU